MRRLALAMSMLAATIIAPATAHGFVGAPITHGPDPTGVGQGPEAAAAPMLSKRQAKLVPSAWCGTETGSDDTVNEVDNGRFRYHAVYMLTADAPDRFTALATAMQTDALQASSLLESSYGRAIRFDIGTSCGPTYLDISVVRMTQTTAEMTSLARTPSGTFDAVSKALDGAGFTTIQPSDSIATAAARTRNYLVWLDGPAPAGSCGQAAIYDDPSRAQDNLNNFGGKTAIVFRNGAAFCSSNAVRHEIGHNLGALQPSAPHAFDGAHCNDAYEDTMCYSNSPQVGDGNRGQFFDYGNDDYWSLPGAPLPWWTVDENRFLCPDTTCNMVTQTGTEPDVSPPTDLVPQPEPSPTVAPARANRTAPRRRARLSVRAKRHRNGVWRLRLRATGEGNATVVVRCRRARHGQVRTVLRRTTRLPRTLHVKVRCVASRPRAKLYQR